MLTQPCLPGTVCNGIRRRSLMGLFPDRDNDPCPAGKYCPLGSLNPIDCPAGTYSEHPGRGFHYDCTGTPAGYWTSSGATSYSANTCSPGYYCLANSTSSTSFKCPKGTFRTLNRGEKPEDCAICPAGYYCDEEALVIPKDCPVGRYCPQAT